jgi:serine/threonine protein kinase
LFEPNSEPLPGYRLEKRIGSGGYGDVWKATAPGGLAKAIKIIHGDIDGTRAVRELRSLERAKSLNHPFLLSLERIEIVDSHLLVVTELADATLRDRFEQCIAQGLPGIPREELLEYMREAADALDYLFDSHALQHLDVKPENLLLRGKHIKVADFGLLKDLQESCASFVTGMTPKYSAPELFGGKPARHSDQYSLAIVYQEMVAGRLPFAGSNIASLASQHLHATPDVSPLEPLERFAVAKALSKDPQHRFPSCQAFVERLRHRAASVLTTGAPVPSPNQSAPGQVAFDQKQTRQQRESSHIHDGHTIEMAAPEIRSLPRLMPPDGPVTYRPVLFIGIGGLGGRVLSKLRQLLTDRIGEAKNLPALQFLYIDTDEDALFSIAKGPINEGLNQDEILIAPLRQTQDYRRAAVSGLESLSRRWIYNVPRSLRTQGLRALGRIALLDHADRLLDRLRRALGSCTDTSAAAVTSEHSTLNFTAIDPRVFVVASAAGGTGSGMVIDAGYAVRQVLAESGFTDDFVCGILACTTEPGTGPVGVAPANTFACLEELRYFSQPGCDYPGEPACGLAGFRGAGPTFPTTYLFDLPAAGGADETIHGPDALAEYLFLSSISSASGLFDQCRRLERERPSTETLRLRTAGLCSLTAASSEDPAPFAERLCNLLVGKWKLGIDSAVSDERVKLTDTGRLYEVCDPQGQACDSIKQLACAQMERLGVSLRAVCDRLSATVAAKLGTDPRLYMGQVIEDSLAHAARDHAEILAGVEVALRRIHAIMGVDKDIATQRDKPLESLADVVRTEARCIGSSLGKSSAAWILDLVESGSSRVDSARRAVKWVAEFVRELRQTATEQSQNAEQDLATATKAIASLQCHNKLPTADVVVSALMAHAECHLNLLIARGVSMAIRTLDPEVTAASDELRELWKDLSQLSDNFKSAKSGGDASASQTQPDANAGKSGPLRMAQFFANQQRDLIEELDRAVEAQFFKDGRGLRQVLVGSGSLREDLVTYMRASARKIILRAYHSSIHLYVTQALKGGQNDELASLVHNCLETARPGLLSLGGAKRLLVSIPKQLDVMHLARGTELIAQERVSVSIEQEGDVKFCYEVEELPWEGIETKLIRQRHDCSELARRLHTRINLDWNIV